MTWNPGAPLPPPGMIVGDVSLHAPGIKFGVVTAPESAVRPVADICETAWPNQILTNKAEETKRYQQETWGATGLDILAIADDLELAREEAYWAAHAQAADDELDALDMELPTPT